MKIKLHVHRREVPHPMAPEGTYGSFMPEAINEIELWAAGWSRKPLYAINVIPKEVTSGSST